LRSAARPLVGFIGLLFAFLVARRRPTATRADAVRASSPIDV